MRSGAGDGAAAGSSNRVVEDEQGGDEDTKNHAGENNGTNDDNEVLRSGDEGDRTERREQDGVSMSVELVYDLKGLLRLNHDNWKPQKITIDAPQISLDDFFDQVARHVEAKLSNDEEDCYKTLEKKKDERFLLLRPVLQSNCPVKRRAFQLDDSGVPRVLAVEYLLCDEPKEGETPLR